MAATDRKLNPTPASVHPARPPGQSPPAPRRPVAPPDRLIRPRPTARRTLPSPSRRPSSLPIALLAPSPAVSAPSTTQPPSPPVPRPPLASPACSRLAAALGPHAASALAPAPGGPVAHGPARASRPLSRRCLRILSITAGSWISAITRISPPQRGHFSGSTSYTSRMSSAQRPLASPREKSSGATMVTAPASGSAGSVAGSPVSTLGSATAASAFRRSPRVRFA